MKALVISRAGGPEVLEIQDREAPRPGPGDVLVAVRAAGVNRADLLQRRGLYPAPRGVVPDVPGLEFAGDVVEVGSSVPAGGVAVGARVMGIVAGGAQAELLRVPHRQCVPIPARLGWEEAAALCETSVTAWNALFREGGLAAGGSALVTAAASGVGTAALAWLRARRHPAIGWCRTPAKRARLARTLGYEIHDPATDAAREARDLDTVLDLVGGPGLDAFPKMMRPGGTIVLVGLLGGGTIELDLRTVLARRITLRGTVLRSRSATDKAELIESWALEALPLLDAGHLHPTIDRTFALEHGADAHRLLEANDTLGKVVLTIGAT